MKRKLVVVRNDGSKETVTKYNQNAKWTFLTEIIHKFVNPIKLDGIESLEIDTDLEF